MKFFHIDHIYSVKKIMFFVLIACIPGIITKCYFFGISTLIQIFFSIIIALLLEAIILKIRFNKVNISIYDNSSILTATLFGVSIPSSLPFWMIIIGIFFSIVVSKHLYGGIGQNIFNPAMVGYVVLLISFPLCMTNWHEKKISISYFDDLKTSFETIFLKKNTSIINSKLNIFPDAFTEATPLDYFKNKSHFKYDNLLSDSEFKNRVSITSVSWRYINISFLLGGFFLFLKKIICWRIPISFLTTLGVISSITYFYSTDLFASPLFHFFSGGTMICAFFIATDPVTTACTNKGRIIFGIIIGFLVWIIRNYSNYPDAIAFSVLFANMTVPLIDFYTKTSGYGHSQT